MMHHYKTRLAHLGYRLIIQLTASAICICNELEDEQSPTFSDSLLVPLRRVRNAPTGEDRLRFLPVPVLLLRAHLPGAHQLFRVPLPCFSLSAVHLQLYLSAAA